MEGARGWRFIISHAGCNKHQEAQRKCSQRQHGSKTQRPTFKTHTRCTPHPNLTHPNQSHSTQTHTHTYPPTHDHTHTRTHARTHLLRQRPLCLRHRLPPRRARPLQQRRHLRLHVALRLEPLQQGGGGGPPVGHLVAVGGEAEGGGLAVGLGVGWVWVWVWVGCGVWG